MKYCKRRLNSATALKCIMLLTCIVSICTDLYVDFLHAYKFSIVRTCVICAICFFAYKKKRVAEICYCLFSGIVIFAGIISMVLGVVKVSRGILPKIRCETIIAYTIRAALQAGLLYMVVRLKHQGKDKGR